MSKLEYTCGNCEHVKVSDMCGLKIAFCGIDNPDNGPIVPHESEHKDGKRSNPTIIKFSRIPIECKSNDENLVKSKKPANRKKWVIKEF